MNALKKINEFKSNQKIKVFMVFLFFSTLFWLFSTLSEKATYLTNYSIKYNDIPENFLFQTAPPSEVQAQVETSGFRILGQRIKSKKLVINFSNFSKKRYSSTYYFPLNRNIAILQKQLKATKLIRFTNDSLQISLGKLISKRIPIVSQIQFNFEPGFQFTEDIHIEPKYVTIEGPKELIDNINQIKTEALILNEIKSNFDREVRLIIPNNNTISLDYKKVIFSGKVAQYTDGQIELDIKMLNAPKNSQIEIYPKTARLKYQIAFEDYQKINKESVSIICKYPRDSSKKTKNIPLALANKPDYIKEYSIHPSHVSFLVKK